MRLSPLAIRYYLTYFLFVFIFALTCEVLFRTVLENALYTIITNHQAEALRKTAAAQATPEGLATALARLAGETRITIILTGPSGQSSVYPPKQTITDQTGELLAGKGYFLPSDAKNFSLSRQSLMLLAPEQAPLKGYRILARMTESQFEALSARLVWPWRTGVWAVCLLLLLTGLVFARSLTAPLEKLNSLASRITSGDYGHYYLEKTASDYHHLAQSLNTLSARLAHLDHRLSQREQEIHSLFSAIQAGLALLDAKGRIRLFNQAFTRITESPNPQYRYYWEILRDNSLHEKLALSMAARENFTGDIVYRQRWYHLRLIGLPDSDQTVVAMEDITEQRQLEEMKRDFAANAAHELKTPLTVILGHLENLMDSPLAAGEKNSLQAIERNTLRMQRIAADLLTLTSLENSGGLEIRDTALNTVLESIRSVFEPRLKDKGLTMTVSVAEDCQTIPADGFLLEQALINLTDNAIKYTERGSVAISCTRRGNTTVLEVRDTGCGIPREHLPRLFERFYVVDRSRSRQLGGTGLGLAIVKHIILNHGWDIEVDSTTGQGSTFRILIPVNSGVHA